MTADPQPTRSPSIALADTAAAADGGSLYLQLKVGEVLRPYVLNRSLTARGTPAFEQISTDGGALAHAQQAQLLANLELLGAPESDDWTVLEFVKVLRTALRQA